MDRILLKITLSLILATVVRVGDAQTVAPGDGSLASGIGPKRPQVKEPELRIELLKRMKADQDVRGKINEWQMKNSSKETFDEDTFEASLNPEQKAEWKALGDTMQRTDAENTKRMEEIVDRHGWPTSTLVGKDGSFAAWLLVQHADGSPMFQRKCLDLMSKVPHDEVRPCDLAYLTDRVLLAEGKKQRYGSQISFTGGKCKPQPIEDEANVNRRRKEVGLEPIEEYLKMVEGFYGGGPKDH